MNLTQEHIELENRFKLLIGLTLRKVEYLEVDYFVEDPNPRPWYQTKFKEIDSVDFSVVLSFNNETHAEIYWDGQFFQYGIGLQINSDPIFPGARKWEVTENNLWKKIIRFSIIDTIITWESVITTEEKTGEQKYIYYPKDLKVTFSNDQHIFISAAGFINEKDDAVYSFMDNLLVTDNEALAKKLNIIS